MKGDNIFILSKRRYKDQFKDECNECMLNASLILTYIIQLLENDQSTNEVQIRNNLNMS